MAIIENGGNLQSLLKAKTVTVYKLSYFQGHLVND